MGDLWVNVAVVLFFILVGGCFAAAELALVTVRESQVQRLAIDGKRGRRLAALTANPNRFLAAVQVGVTLAGFVSAGFGAAQIAPVLSPVLIGWGLGQGLAETLAFIVVTIVIAYLSLVLGELVPKRFALQRVERVALLSAAPIDILATVFRPFIAALSMSTDVIVRMLGGDPSASKEQMSGEELRDLVAAHEDLTADERRLIDDVFDAGDRELREVMLPRTEVAFLDAAMPLATAANVVADQPHSRYPVIRDDADDVIGFVHIRDILAPGQVDRSLRVGDLARPITAFPGTKIVLATLNEMRRLGQHLAMVQDEYGGTAGIVTMEDLVEELVGDIRDEYDAADARLHDSAGDWVVDGLLNLEDFADETGYELPEGPYETVAGFIVARLGRLPRGGDTVSVGDVVLEVGEVNGRRISRVHVIGRAVEEAADEADADGPTTPAS